MAYEAGPELDAMIALRVFGASQTESWTYALEYSTDIAAAWKVFIWLTETTGRCIIIADMEEWDADNAVIVRCGLDEDHDIESYWHPAPLALCLAAIDYLDRKAKGGR